MQYEEKHLLIFRRQICTIYYIEQSNTVERTAFPSAALKISIQIHFGKFSSSIAFLLENCYNSNRKTRKRENKTSPISTFPPEKQKQEAAYANKPAGICTPD